MNAKKKWTIFICCATIPLTACREAAPKGQVVAIANGEEITIGELQAEAAARDLQNADSSAARSELLQAVLDRKLWAQEAKRAKLDRQIQHVLARRRAEERLLADLQVRALENAVEPPSDEDIKRYLRRNPAAFASQTIFKIDQINVQTDGNTLTAEVLAQANSLDELDKILTRSGIVGQRSRTDWNSMFMPASLVARVKALPPGKMFIYRNSDTLIAAVVVATTNIPLSDSNRKLLVRKSLTQQKINAAVARRTNQLRASAKIRLQAGYRLSDATQ